ncbi:MAG: hypothetical protein GXO47_06235 [Chlorobi bacterium]|nr:hypothetical protein [Chlorobiota bacterium]
MADKNELLTAHLYITAVFPVIKVLLKDDPSIAKKFKTVNATVVFKAKNDNKYTGATLIFNNGELEVLPEPVEKADIVFKFGSVKKMNTFLKGGAALPSIKGYTKSVLLFKIISALLRLKLMMPDVRPKKEHEKYLKVKLALYMVSTALSKLNKYGDEKMKAWTDKQPDRIYQLSVDHTDIAVYLRVKAGKTKAGRGFYQRKRPFVHLKFANIDDALKVLLKDVEFVEAVDKKYISITGSPEYANMLNDFMMHIQAVTT